MLHLSLRERSRGIERVRESRSDRGSQNSRSASSHGTATSGRTVPHRSITRCLSRRERLFYAAAPKWRLASSLRAFRSVLPLPRTGIASTSRKLSGAGNPQVRQAVGARGGRRFPAGDIASCVWTTISRSPLRSSGTEVTTTLQLAFVFDAENLVDRFLDADVRHHLAADF